MTVCVHGDETSVIPGLTRNLWKIGVGLIQTLNQVQGDGLRLWVTWFDSAAGSFAARAPTMVRQAHQPWFGRLYNRGSTGSPTARQRWFAVFVRDFFYATYAAVEPL